MDFPSLHFFCLVIPVIISPSGRGSGNLYPLAAFLLDALGGIFHPLLAGTLRRTVPQFGTAHTNASEGEARVVERVSLFFIGVRGHISGKQQKTLYIFPMAQSGIAIK